MLKISFTNAEVSDHGYGLEVNGKSLEDIISTALGTKLNCSFNLNGNNTSGNRNRNFGGRLLYVHIKIKENQRNMCSL